LRELLAIQAEIDVEDEDVRMEDANEQNDQEQEEEFYTKGIQELVEARRDMRGIRCPERRGGWLVRRLKLRFHYGRMSSFGRGLERGCRALSCKVRRWRRRDRFLLRGSRRMGRYCRRELDRWNQSA